LPPPTTQRHQARDAPTTYEDLLNPRFKGKLAVEAEDANWFMSVVLSMGEEKGLKLFRDIVASNGMSVRKGHTLLANLVPTGEVPLALTAYSYRVEQLKNEGAPIEIVYLPPPVAFRPVSACSGTLRIPMRRCCSRISF